MGCGLVVMSKDETFGLHLVVEDIGIVRDCTSHKDEDEKNDEIRIGLRLEVGGFIGEICVEMPDEEDGNDKSDENERCHPHPCSKGEMKQSVTVDVSQNGQTEHGGEIGEGIPPWRKVGEEMDHSLKNLQNGSDDDGADEEVVGGGAMRIDELGFGQKVALQEVEVGEGEKHKQNPAGILDDSCGFLFEKVAVTHNYSAFL